MTYRLARSMKKKDSQFITVISGAEVSEEDAEHTTELVQSKCGSSVEVSQSMAVSRFTTICSAWNDPGITDKTIQGRTCASKRMFVLCL